MKILFICKGNMYRSVMAEALYNQITGTHDAVSAGTYVGAWDEPEGRVLKDIMRPGFFDILEDEGIYIRNYKTRKLLPGMIDTSDVVVSMAEEPFIPDFVRNDKKIILWDVENNSDNPKKTFDELRALVENLVASFK